MRSEERRVGKECRARWSPDQQKKKRGEAGGEERCRERWCRLGLAAWATRSARSSRGRACSRRVRHTRCASGVAISLFFCFFFSSRRRHTRWTGDWSSDVCSSDLVLLVVVLRRGGAGAVAEEREGRPAKVVVAD